MFKFSQLKSIHIELTNKCQARCPMCARNYHGGLPNPLLKNRDWSYEDFEIIINQEVLDTVEKIYFCGNFGDPMIHDDLIKMCQYIKERNPEIMIGIHTNGAARKEDWWKQLAENMPKKHCVHFAIDGLEDTHHLYRIGTKYENVIRNASSFINAGGQAEWTFIKFKHNEHQIDECKERAKKLGFQKFSLKNSSRFLAEPKYDVLDSAGKITHIIEPSSDTKIKFMPKEIINSYKDIVKEATIECFVQEIKEIYIDAYQVLLPCCWLSSIPHTYYDPHHVNHNVSAEIKSQYDLLISDFGGIDKLDAHRGIKNIIESQIWQDIWNRKWNEEKMITCARVCGKFKTVEISQPNDQFLNTSIL